MVREIVQYIANQTGLVIGTELLSGYRTLAAQDDCSVVLERVPGREDPEHPGHYELPIQILTRARDYYDARNQALLIYGVVYGKQRAGFDLPVITSGEAWRVGAVVGNRPGYLGQDAQHRHEFSTNLVFRIEPS